MAQTSPRSCRVETNGIHLHTVQAGPETGPLVLLLHGFPEFWYGWRKQIPALADAGYRVWVPDQRGYNLSDKPPAIAAYNLDTLALDIVGLMDAAGVEQAYVVGHDWGAAVAWWLGIKHAHRVRRLAILNVPHPAVMRRYMRTHLSQLRKSWYMFFFQIPRLPEYLLGRRNHEVMVRMLRSTARPDAFTEEDFRTYRQAWSRPGALTGMIHWYRAMFQRPPAPATSYRVPVPVRIIWGRQDPVLEWPLAPLSLDLCDQGEVHWIHGATHWLQHEEAEEVNGALLEFLAGGDDGR